MSYCDKLSGFWRGDTKEVKFIFNSVDGTPIDVTGWVLTWTFKSAPSDTVPALQVETTAGDHAQDDPLNGIIWLAITSDLSETLEPGFYYYDIERKIPGNPPIVKTLLPKRPQDKIQVFEDITHA